MSPEGGPSGPADPAAGLHRHAGFGRDAGDQLRVDRPAFFRAVEIDDVQPCRALPHPLERRFDRIVEIDRFAAVIALRQPDAAAAANVDRRINRKRH